MATRIGHCWEQLSRRGEKGLITFTMAGDPDMERSLELVLAMADAGADIVELGIPFSAPIIDGPVIQRAGARAYSHGAILPRVLELVRDIRQKSEVPLVLMSYLNPILRYGFERFANEAVASGVDGALISDLSVEEADPYVEEMRRKGLDTIFLAAPSSTEARLQRVVEYATGFIYAITRMGTTGEQQKLSDDILPLISRLRALTRTPIAAGIGISRPEHLARLGPVADGTVVGSALVRCLEEHLENPAPAMAKMVQWLREGFSSAQSMHESPDSNPAG
jgi:tryptophan synthase alpha chain